MPGYDTVVCAVPASFDSALAWSKSAETVSGPTVVRRHLARLGDHITVQHAEQLQDGKPLYAQLSVQASLPKVLHGQNVDEVGEPLFVAHALGVVQVGLEKFLGRTIDLWSWQLQRVDVTCNRRLSDQSVVAAVLQRLAFVPYRGRLPVRGESASVTWPAKRGGFTKTCYSKLDESGVPAAVGVLRGEVRAHGQQAVRRGWGVGEDVHVLVADLMTKEGEGARGRVAAWTTRAMDRAVETVPMQLVEAVERLRRVSKRDSAAIRLLGFAVMVQLVGEQHLVKSGMLTRQAVWLAKKDFEVAGVNPYEVEFPGGPEALATMVEDEFDQLETDPVKFAAEAVDAIESLDGEPVRDAADLVERTTGPAVEEQVGTNNFGQVADSPRA